jgi:thiamine pyrophosphate-dependent acetolactate synthase large subunit-like protein
MDNLDLVQIAASSGYAKTYEFDKLEEFLIGLEDIMRQTGPVFVRVKVFRDGIQLPFPERTMAEGWAEVRGNLTSAEEETS